MGYPKAKIKFKNMFTKTKKMKAFWKTKHSIAITKMVLY